jgi:hypothetical protein
MLRVRHRSEAAQQPRHQLDGRGCESRDADKFDLFRTGVDLSSARVRRPAANMVKP